MSVNILYVSPNTPIIEPGKLTDFANDTVREFGIEPTLPAALFQNGDLRIPDTYIDQEIHAFGGVDEGIVFPTGPQAERTHITVLPERILADNVAALGIANNAGEIIKAPEGLAGVMLFNLVPARILGQIRDHSNKENYLNNFGT